MAAADHPDDAASARIEILKKELATSRALMVRARDGLGSSGEMVSLLRLELQAVRDQSAELRGLLQKVHVQVDRQAAEHAEDRARMEARQAELQAHVAALQAQIAALHRSFSWRITKPVRFATRVARRLVGAVRGLSPGNLRGAYRRRRAEAAIRRSGLFDPAWYLEAYPDLAGARIDPLTHYLDHGWREGRRPGPAFDLDYYRYANPDIAKAGLDPLSHYVVYGAREGRDFRAVGQWRPPASGFGEKRETAPILPAPELDPQARPSIVVAVHAYYPDVFDALCARLAEIPGRFTLLASTPTEAVRRAVLASIAAHCLDADADVRVTQNRGRNFGPLFSEFGPVILKHDLLLHIHTKKSLHNAAGEQTAWRDDILDGLIQPGGGAASVIGLFERRPEIGLVFTRTFRHMAYWANHWLQNGGQARALFQRLGVRHYTLRGYIDYPVGGMFWARVRAIAPLFEIGLSYADFPPEAGQLDGTIAHAIERSFVDLARARGFTFAEADPDENLFRLGWSDKNLDRYELNTLERLKLQIDKAELVSFDLFDTVLQRPSVSPDAVQRYAGLLLAREHPEAPDFYTARKAAEHAARAAKGFEGDVGLPAIYAQMKSAGWDEDALARARELEVGIERQIALSRPPVVEALRHAKARGKRVLAVSDTYFGPDDIQGLLTAAGIEPDLFDEVLLSSEQGARKDRGDLWKAIGAREKTPPGRWLHLGDNEVSDMQRAGDLGMAVFHTMNPATLLLQKGFLTGHSVQAADEAHGWADALLLGPATARLAADPFPEGGALGPSRIEAAHDLGYCAYGPALFAFCAWLANRPQARKLERLYFLSREGWALMPIYERIRGALGEAKAPPSRYLHASRRSVLLAAQAGGLDPAALIEGPEYKGDLAGLLRARLGVEIPAGTEINGAARIKLPEDAEAVRDALEVLRKPIETQAKRERKALIAYLKGQGLDAKARAGVVDVGYRATIQKGLQAALGRGLAGFYMATFPAAVEAGQAQADGSAGSTIGFFGDWIDPLGETPIVTHAILLEAFLTAPQGQVDHFEPTAGGGAEPVFLPNSRSEADLATLAELHAGALAYADDLIRWYGPAVASLEFSPAAALEPLIAFARGRLLAPREVLHALRVDDAFCGYEEHEVGLDLVGGGSGSED